MTLGKTMNTTFLIVLLLAAAAILVACGGSVFHPKDINVPKPTVWRTDLLYGYFNSKDNQVAQTKDHINLYMEGWYDGYDQSIQNILNADKITMLDVSWFTFVDTGGTFPRTVRPDAEAALRNMFTDLRNRGAINKIKYIYPLDEPNNVVTLDILKQGFAVIKKVVAEFPELNGVKYVVIYAADKPYIGIDMYDIAGFDDYYKKSQVLGEPYQMLLNQLRPVYKTI